MSEPTYETFELHSLTAVQGWQAVFWGETNGHFTMPIYALAIATRHTRFGAGTWRSGEEVPWSKRLGSDYREIVGLEYTISDGWHICEETGNYCGLLPPGATLEDFERDAGCRHTAKKTSA